MSFLLHQKLDVIWRWLGLLKDVRIVMLGPESAGKTSILNRLLRGTFDEKIPPTHGMNVETVAHKDLRLCIWDFGRKIVAPSDWHHYLRNTQTLIFVVDSTDPSMFEQACSELLMVLEDALLNVVPLLVLSTKCDVEGASSLMEVSNALKLSTIEARDHSILSTSALTGEGLNEALEWIEKRLET
ncbi:hypothetical protein PRIPAC_89266 [Pristionchus pacificus]|uniref:ADP-ribosylation factor-like protein 6 n=1 Tax=Pristionchus pacificus TaxID=54126 RepID=A0A2A6B418_PRIPA|nr:hypothetical protein PRIPAC_89266 [Pristionchus pacificus]|eukprot:PDM60614.1 ADP ribosylation factor [Pristionchus pacificus]